MKALNWWRDACNEWCYARHENGKFGDQKYLDDWTTRFEGVHVLKNLGGGVAPWNVQQYNLTDGNFNLIFYHFHGYRIFENEKIDCGSYKLDENDMNILYKPYTRHIENITLRLKIIDSVSDYNGIVKIQPFYWKTVLEEVKRRFRGTYYVFSKKELLRF